MKFIFEDAAPSTNLIPNVFYDNHDDLLAAIIKIHCPGGFDLDACYSKGNFYKSGVIPKPRFRFDIDPEMKDCRTADCRHLPLPDSSISSSIFDPPFLHAHGENSIIGNRFGSFKNQTKARKFYLESFVEQWRVLEPEATLTVKTQDIVQSGKQVWNHIWFYENLQLVGFVPVDLAAFFHKTRIKGHNHNNQQHLRKYNSWFWTAIKPKRKRR